MHFSCVVAKMSQRKTFDHLERFVFCNIFEFAIYFFFAEILIFGYFLKTLLQMVLTKLELQFDQWLTKHLKTGASPKGY